MISRSPDRRASSTSTKASYARAPRSARWPVLVVENREAGAARSQAGPGGEAAGWVIKTRITQPSGSGGRARRLERGQVRLPRSMPVAYGSALDRDDRTPFALPVVFLSYCREDAEWLRRFAVMLKPEVRNRPPVRLWHDTLIGAGRVWRPELEDAISRTVVAPTAHPTAEPQTDAAAGGVRRLRSPLAASPASPG
jgi:hypothetical protein